MPSIAGQIVDNIQTAVDAGKSVIQTVTNEMLPLSYIVQLPTSSFPHVTIIADDVESERPQQLVGGKVQRRLAVSIICIVNRVSNLELEMDNAQKEIRDIVELPANRRWSNLAIDTTLPRIVRSAAYNDPNTKGRVLGAVRIDFFVDYEYTLGSS